MTKAADKVRLLEKPRKNVDIEDTPNEGPCWTDIIFRLFVLAGGAVFVYSSRIPRYFADPTGLVKTPFMIGLISSTIFSVTVLALVIWRHVLQRVTTFRHWKARMRRPILALTATGVASYLCYSIAFWPVYGIGGFFIFGILSYVVLCGLCFV